MKTLRKLLGNWWVVSIAIALLAVLVLIVLLPMVLPPLRPFIWRLTLLLVVTAVWGGLAAWRVFSARQASDRIADALGDDATAPGETAALTKRMSDALAGLREASGGRRDYLYSRPWYVIIGPPGAGKTTALLNSGLRFPFSDASLKGVGGTRNLDFWFADEAVMVDTAGRYTSQDSSADRDREGWTGFLDLLRKNRPLQPINGVLVAIGADMLTQSDAAALDQHAATVRRRLAELQSGLEIRVPVYVVFTKADLLAGFSEFFDDLDVEGRRAVLGATLPLEDDRPTAETFVRAFDAVAQSVADRRSKRLQDELDMRRRGLIIGFPDQLSGLRGRVTRFLNGAFPPDAAETPAQARGFYFTSGVQQGTPLDRLLSGFTSIHDSPAPIALAGASGGRAYFLNRLLTEVVFGEAGLVRTSPQARARRAAMLTGGYAAIAGVCALVLLAWTVSFIGNRNLQTQLLAGAQSITAQLNSGNFDRAEVRQTDPDLEASLSVLRSLRDLPSGYAARRKGGAPILLRFGLFQNSLSVAAEQAYLETLRRVMLPRVVLRLEAYQHEHAPDPLALYEPLKAYLMLRGDHALDRSAVKAWIVGDWATTSYPGADRDDTRRQLAQHLDALLADPDISRAWPNRVAPLDEALIDSSRRQVETLSLADRAYAVLRQKAAASGQEGWRAANVLPGGQFTAFQNPDAARSLTVPYLFTRDGYAKAYQLGLQTVETDLRNDLWVLNQDQQSDSIRVQMQGLKAGVAAHYASDYIASWQAVEKALLPADYFSDASAYAAMMGMPSPWKQLLAQVHDQTSLGGGTAMDSLTKVASAKVASLEPKALQAGAAPGGPDAGQQISQAFQPLATFVGDGKSPAPIDAYLTALKAAVDAKKLVDMSSGGPAADAAQIQANQATVALGSAAVQAPSDLQGFAAQAAKKGDSARAVSATGAVDRDYDQSLRPQCDSVTANRYPFVQAAAADAPMGDVQSLFRPGAPFDTFTTRLQSYIDSTGAKWRWRANDPVAAGFDPTSPEQFQKAHTIRDLLSAGIPFHVEAVGFGAAVTAAEFSVSGVSNTFEPNQPGSKPYQWSPTGLQEAHVSMTVGGRQQVIPFSGPWAVFRLLDQARKENAGPTAFKATFGEGAATVTFRLVLQNESNPFSRGGAWSFRCPSKL
jgi:type VI secretion system protein ImpL